MTKKKSSFSTADGYKDEDYIHYVYKITNITNNRYYIGIHSTLKSLNKTPLEDGYWGSGTEITKAIKADGKENFKKEILGIFSTREEISLEEQKLVTIEIIRSSESYNMILGGDSGYQSNMGWIICRPKNAIEKVIKISREEYYKNKDLYVITGHLKYYLNGSAAKEPKQQPKQPEYRKKFNTQSVSDNRKGKFEGRSTLINIKTSEVRVFEKKDFPESIYEEWYPYYFIDKSTNLFISKDYLISEYKKLSNLNKLAEKFKIGRISLDKIIDYYNIRQFLQDNATNSIGHHINITGFSGKTFIHNDIEELVIDIGDLERYLSLGYLRGKKSTCTVKYEDLYNFYTSGNNIKACSKEFHITTNLVKSLLKLDKGYTIYWFYSDKLQKCIRFCVTDENMLNSILQNGWIIGRKTY